MRHLEWGGCGHTLQYRYHHKPRPPQWDRPQGFLGGKGLSFYPEGEGEDTEGHEPVLFPSFSSFLPLIHPSTHPSVLPLFAVLHLLVVVALPSTFSFVQHFDRLHQVALEGGECSANGWSAKAVGEQAEVGEAALDTRLQAGGGSTAAQWRAVLGHQVHKFLTDLPETKRDEALGHTKIFLALINYCRFSNVHTQHATHP